MNIEIEYIKKSFWDKKFGEMNIGRYNIPGAIGGASIAGLITAGIASAICLGLGPEIVDGYSPHIVGGSTGVVGSLNGYRVARAWFDNAKRRGYVDKTE